MGTRKGKITGNISKIYAKNDYFITEYKINFAYHI